MTIEINKIMATKWTKQLDQKIIEEVEKTPEHLSHAFFRASLKINKTPHAICTRYYNKILKK